mgnify:CR=1 FL=1
MSRADDIYRATCLDILENGFSDEGLEVRPKWADGTPAHTIKKFGVVNRYNLKEEFPIMTLRRTYWKSALDELLWIWQKKSNRIEELGSHVWDEWAGEDGTIGKAYGYQLGIKHQYKEGMFDQVDRVIYDLTDLGCGTMPVAEILRLLQEQKYSGYLSLEWESAWHPELNAYYPDIPTLLSAYNCYIKALLP